MALDPEFNWLMLLLDIVCPVARLLFKRGVEEASHVLLWVVSGGQYRIVAHHVNETRRFPTWVAPTLRFASPFLPLPSVCSARLTSPL